MGKQIIMRKDQAQFLPCLKAEVSLREMMNTHLYPCRLTHFIRKELECTRLLKGLLAMLLMAGLLPLVKGILTLVSGFPSQNCLRIVKGL
jgi:hypothetical protein